MQYLQCSRISIKQIELLCPDATAVHLPNPTTHVLGAGIQRVLVSAGWSLVKARHTHTLAGPEEQAPWYQSYACSHVSRVQRFATPRTEARQAPLSMGILQARILELVAISSSRASSGPRDRTRVSSLLHCQVNSVPPAPCEKEVNPHTRQIATVVCEDTQEGNGWCISHSSVHLLLYLMQPDLGILVHALSKYKWGTRESKREF